MKLLIVGSRSITDFDLSTYVDDSVDLIISCGAGGVDTLAEKYAYKKGISKLILRPDYKHYRKAAPIIRHKLMVDICDALLVVWDGKSRGTKHTIDYAQKAQKALTVLSV